MEEAPGDTVGKNRTDMEFIRDSRACTPGFAGWQVYEEETGRYVADVHSTPAGTFRIDKLRADLHDVSAENTYTRLYADSVDIDGYLTWLSTLPYMD